MSNLNDTWDEISPRKDANVDINYIEGVFRLVRLNPGIILDKLLKKMWDDQNEILFVFILSCVRCRLIFLMEFIL